MAKGLGNKALTKDYTTRRKLVKKDKSFQIKDPDKSDRMISFPLELRELLETVYPRTMNNAVNHTDNMTGFKWTYGKQQRLYGESRRGRGITMIAKTKVQTLKSFLFISKRGIKVDSKHRNNLAKFQLYPHGSSVWGRDCAAMKANAKAITDDGDVEIENVQMENMSAFTLREKFNFNLEGTKEDMHVVLRNIQPIDINDELVVCDYGPKMPFGHQYYVDAQLQCLQEYKDRLLEIPRNRKLCPTCFELLPYTRAQHRTHNFVCKGPFIWNFLAPIDNIVNNPITGKEEEVYVQSKQ